jgi:hypothetical protein
MTTKRRQAHLSVFTLIVLSVGFFSACQFTMPHSAEIKASPTVYAPLGEATVTLSDYLSPADLFQGLEEAVGEMPITFYDYIDPAEPDVFKVVAHYPVLSVPLDLGEYLDQIDLDSMLAQSIPTISIPVPSISESVSDSISLALSDDILAAIQNSIAPVNNTLYETGLPSTQELPPFTADINLSEISGISFTSGTMRLNFSTSGTTAGLVLTLSNIELRDASDQVLLSSTDTVDAVAGGYADFDLSGVTLPENSVFHATVTTSGGTMGQGFTLTSTPSLIDPVISAVSGLTLSEALTIPTTPIDVGSAFIEAAIAAGSMELTVDALPATWTGFTRTVSISVQQTDGLTLSDSTTGTTLNFDLAGQSINSNPISVSGEILIEATDGTINELSAEPYPFNYTTAFEITGFTSITIAEPAGMESSYNINQTLPTDLTDLVSQIVFAEVGADLSITNTLPTGNNLNMDISSAAFGISTQSISALGGESIAQEFSVSNTNYTFVPASYPTVDFNITLGLSGWDQVAETITISGIEPGQTYTIGGDVQLIMDWTSVTVDASSFTQIGSYPAVGDDPISLAVINDIIGPGLELADIPTYLFLSGLPEGNTPSGYTRISYTDTEAAAQSLYIVGTDNAGTPDAASIPIVAPVSLSSIAVAAPTDEDPARTYAQLDAFTLPAEGTYSGYVNAADIINDRAADISIDYSIGLGDSFTLEKASLTADSVLTIQAELLLILPLKFNITDPDGVTITIPEMDTLITGDLFGREEEVPLDDDLQMALEALQSISLNLDVTNNLHVNAQATLSAPSSDPEETYEFSKTVNLNNGLQTISLTREDVEYALRTIPFTPQIDLSIPYEEEGYWLSRSGSLTIGVSVGAVTDFEQTFTFDNSDEGGN